MTRPFWKEKEQAGKIICTRCGAELGHFHGGHFFIDRPAHPHGPDFVCDGECKSKAKKQEGGNKNDSNKG
jgi:hypothetical protein